MKTFSYNVDGAAGAQKFKTFHSAREAASKEAADAAVKNGKSTFKIIQEMAKGKTILQHEEAITVTGGKATHQVTNDTLLRYNRECAIRSRAKRPPAAMAVAAKAPAKTTVE